MTIKKKKYNFDQYLYGIDLVYSEFVFRQYIFKKYNGKDVITKIKIEK